MTGCDFLWAACGVRGAVLRCACGDDCAVRSGRGCAGRRAGVRGLCVCILQASVRCALRGLLVCAVLGDTCHDAAVPLCWVGRVASRVFLHARVFCGVMVSGSAALVGMCAVVRVGPAKCEASWRCMMRVLGVHCQRCVERRE